MNARAETTEYLDRLDRLSPWAFTGALYLARWVIIIPISFALGHFRGKVTFDAPPLVLLFGFLVLAPILETMLECVLPYWVMLKLKKVPTDRRPWAFVTLSAVLMTLFHFSAWPSAVGPSFITGAFLAYTYAHFAPAGIGRAVIHTWAFHAAINLIGWLLIVVF